MRTPHNKLIYHVWFEQPLIKISRDNFVWNQRIDRLCAGLQLFIYVFNSEERCYLMQIRSHKRV